MIVRIVPLRWDHYAACRALHEEVFDVWEQPKFWESWQARGDSYVAVQYGTVVGFILATNTKIMYICISPNFQQRGIGTQLLEKVIENKRSVHLVTAGDQRLVRWYEKHGFKVTKTYYTGSEFMGADMVLRQRCRSACCFFKAEI